MDTTNNNEHIDVNNNIEKLVTEPIQVQPSVLARRDHFLKYPHIKNLLSTKKEYMTTDLCIAQHKYDGKNTQFIFEKNKPMNILSRNGHKFERAMYDALPDVSAALEKVQKFVESSNDVTIVNLYGETYGNNIIKRIDYGVNCNVKFFDIVIDGTLLSPHDFYEFASKLDIIDNTVEILVEPAPITTILDFDFSKIITAKNEAIEGAVIKKYNNYPTNTNLTNCARPSNMFIIKVINKQYMDINYINHMESRRLEEQESKKECVKSEEQKKFDKYITMDRIINVYSHDNWNRNQTRQLFNAVVDDAIEDYLNDASNWEELGVEFVAQHRSVPSVADLKKQRLKSTKMFPSPQKRVELFQIIRSIMRDE